MPSHSYSTPRKLNPPYGTLSDILVQLEDLNQPNHEQDDTLVSLNQLGGNCYSTRSEG